MREDKQTTLFEDDDPYMNEWDGMPEFEHEDMRPNSSLIVHFDSEEDRAKFVELLDQPILSTTKFIWYPGLDLKRFGHLRYSTNGESDES